MSTYGARIDEDWKPSPLYRSPGDAEMYMHPILHNIEIRKRQKLMENHSISEFKVTKLPRGQQDEFTHFEPKRVPIRRPARNSKQTKEEIKQEAVTAFKKQEEQLTNGVFDSAETS